MSENNKPETDISSTSSTPQLKDIPRNSTGRGNGQVNEDNNIYGSMRLIENYSEDEETLPPLKKAALSSHGKSMQEILETCEEVVPEYIQRQIGNESNAQVVPAKSGPSVLAVMVDQNYSKYSRLSNSHVKPYINVPINSPSLSYALPIDYKLIEVNPGVVISIIFNSDTVKTGYIRIAPRAVKPFEKTTTSEICLALMEGSIRVKSSCFEFDEKGDPVLESIELSSGSHIYIPNDSMYTLENLTDEDCSIYFCMIRL